MALRGSAPTAFSDVVRNRRPDAAPAPVSTCAAITLNVVQMPAKANGGRSSLIANHTTSFFFVSGSAPARTLRSCWPGPARFSGFSQPRQCGDDVLRMLVTGGPPVRGGGGAAPPHWAISVPVSVLRTTEPDNPGTRPASARGCQHSG